MASALCLQAWSGSNMGERTIIQSIKTHKQWIFVHVEQMHTGMKNLILQVPHHWGLSYDWWHLWFFKIFLSVPHDPQRNSTHCQVVKVSNKPGVAVVQSWPSLPYYHSHHGINNCNPPVNCLSFHLPHLLSSAALLCFISLLSLTWCGTQPVFDGISNL